ncbi:hypothetical protein [Neobacillus drentensis]
MPYNSWDKVKATLAQRLGIADKQFTMKDIIYFKKVLLSFVVDLLY